MRRTKKDAQTLIPTITRAQSKETRPTLLIDEADTFLQGNDELRGILNSGYSRKTAYVVRVANAFPRWHEGGEEEEARRASPDPVADSNGSFPLTPALSPREREKQLPGFRVSDAGDRSRLARFS